MENFNIKTWPDGRKWIEINWLFHHYDEELEEYLDKYWLWHYIDTHRKDVARIAKGLYKVHTWEDFDEKIDKLINHKN